MFVIRHLFLSCVLLGLSLAAGAVPQAPVPVVERLISSAGMDDLLAQYPVLIQRTLARNLAGKALPRGLSQVFDQAIRSSFQPDDLLDEFAQALATRLTPEEAGHALEWYTSPLGRKVVRAEMGAVADGQALESLDQLRERYRGTERERLFAAFDRATGSTETMLDNAQILQLAMAAAITSVVHGPTLPTYDDLKAIILKRRTAMRGEVGEQAYLNYLYTYQHLSLDELKAYIAFARSPAGQAFVQGVNAALKETLQKRSDQMSERLARAGTGSVPDSGV